MSIWDSLAGMLELRLTCAQTAEALAQIAQQGVAIRDVAEEDALTVRFRVRRTDFPGIQRLCGKKGYKLEQCAQIGLYWKLAALKNRKVLLVGMALLMFLLFFLPTRVLFVQIQGNTRIPTRQILAAADECGIRFGASRRQVRSEKLKNRLLAAIPELKWAGINTYGCTAVISVREKSRSESEGEETGGVCGIVASRDAVVDRCTVTRGNQLCQVGQAVEKGDVLISGYTDNGLSIRAVRAEGEITGLTTRFLEAAVPNQYRKRTEKTFVKKLHTLRLGKKQINLWSGSGNLDATCDRICKEYVLRLPGGFSLPVAWIVNICTGYETVAETLPVDEAQALLREFSQKYLTQQMVAGEILQAEDVFLEADGCYRLFSGYYCRELIGAIQWEQDGETNEQIG